MSDDALRTTLLHGWLDRMQAGDRAAANELLGAIKGRLEQMSHRMLKQFPKVNRWTDSGDVAQNAMIRLLRTLSTVRPESVRSFLNLASVHIRRELLDLARHYGGPQGIGANHDSVVPRINSNAAPFEAACRDEDVGELERWQRFHEAVEHLPAEEREVFSLKFYHGWDEERIAELLQVTDRTVRRWWRSAGQRLAEQLGAEMPDE